MQRHKTAQVSLTLLALWSTWFTCASEQSEFTEHVSLHANLTETSKPHTLTRALHNGTEIFISVVNCKGDSGSYVVHWMIRYTECYNTDEELANLFYQQSGDSYLKGETGYKYYASAVNIVQKCSGLVKPLADESDAEWTVKPTQEGNTTDPIYRKNHYPEGVNGFVKTGNRHKLVKRDAGIVTATDTSKVMTIQADGNYILVVYIVSYTDKDLQVNLDVKLRSPRPFPPRYPDAVVLFYLALFIMFLLQTALWLNLVIRNYQRVLRIHNLMTGVLVMCTLHSLSITVHQERINIWAISSRYSTDNIFIAVLSVIKVVLTLFFMIFFSLGEGITKQKFSKRSFICVIISLGIFGSLGIVLSTFGHEQSDNAALVTLTLTIIFALLGFGYVLWIAHNLTKTMRVLRRQNKMSKMVLYIIATLTIITYGLADMVYYAMILTMEPTCITTAWPILYREGVMMSVFSSTFLWVIMILIQPTANNLKFLHYQPLSDISRGENGAVGRQPLLTEERKHKETAV